MNLREFKTVFKLRQFLKKFEKKPVKFRAEFMGSIFMFLRNFPTGDGIGAVHLKEGDIDS